MDAWCAYAHHAQYDARISITKNTDIRPTVHAAATLLGCNSHRTKINSFSLWQFYLHNYLSCKGSSIRFNLSTGYPTQNYLPRAVSEIGYINVSTDWVLNFGIGAIQTTPLKKIQDEILRSCSLRAPFSGKP